MYKIYYLRHTFRFLEMTEESSLKDFDFVLSESDLEDITSIIEGLKRAVRPMSIVLLGDPKKMYKKFKKEVPPVSAGGGIVLNENGHLLMIKRLGLWDLPKGKLDNGETIEECAIREVEEECNIFGLSSQGKYGNTRHIFKRKGKYSLKVSTWFEMTATEIDKAKPQESENIESVKWFNPGKLDLDDIDTYPAIRDLLISWKASRNFKE